MQSIDIFEPLIAVVISSHVIRQFFCKIAHIVISIIHNTFWSARVRNDGVTSFLLSATHVHGKVLFRDQIFEIEILMDLHYLRFLEK